MKHENNSENNPSIRYRETGEVSELEDPGIDLKSKQITDLIVRANRIFMLDLSRKLKEQRLSYPKYHLLEFLCDADEPIMKELSTKMGTTDAAVTGTIRSLESIGLVERIPSLNDRRKIGIQITKKGREILDEIRASIQDLVACALLAQDSGSVAEEEDIFEELRSLFE